MGRITLDKVRKAFGEVEVIPPLDLTIEDQRIDDRSRVVDHVVFEQLHEPGLRIDLDVAGLDAVRERDVVLARHEMAGRHQLWLEALGNQVGTEIGNPRQFI